MAGNSIFYTYYKIQTITILQGIIHEDKHVIQLLYKLNKPRNVVHDNKHLLSLLYTWICVQNIYDIIFKPFNIIAIFYYSLPSWNEMFTCVVSSLARPVFKEIALTGRILPVMAHKFNIFSRLHNIGQLNGFIFVFLNHFIHIPITFWFPPHLKNNFMLS